MQENISFLRISSVVVKTAAWIFLCLGLFAAVSILFGLVPGTARWVGIVFLITYSFTFFFFYLVAKMAQILSDVMTKLEE